MRYLSFFLLLSLLSSAQEMPSFEEVLGRFHGMYQVKPGEPSQEVWEKHPDGWYWTLHSFVGDRGIIKRKLFWSAESQSYQNLELPKPPEFRDPKGIVEFIMRQEGQAYELQPYYGYAGWEDDAIDYLEEIEDPNSDQLYALGRAFSSKATSLVSSRQAVFQESKRAFISGPEDSLSDKEFNQYKYYRDQAAGAFCRLSWQDPYYATPVGEPGLKDAHEMMTAYVDLRQHYSLGAARSVMRRNLYSGTILGEAFNTLYSCPQDAILITNGDNDTYPLYFAQEFLEVRPDVRILNRSLLNLPAYSRFYREAHGTQKALKFGIDQALLNADASQLAVFRRDSNLEKLSWDDFVKINKDEQNHLKQSQVSVWNLPTMFLEVNYRGSKLQINTKGSLSRSEMLILDLMHNNDVPLCFMWNSPGGKLMPYRNRLRLQGMIYILDTLEKEVPYGQIGSVDFEESYGLLMEKFNYPIQKRKFPSASIYAQNIRTLFATVINGRPDSSYESQCLELLKLAEEKIPGDVYPYDDAGSLQIALMHISFGEEEKGRAILESVKNLQERKLEQSLSDSDRRQAQFLLDNANGILDMLPSSDY